MPTKTLYPSRLKTLALLLVSLILTAGGISIIFTEGGIISWLPALFFGLCSAIFVVMLLPNSSYLKLNEEGFEMCTLYRSHFTRWVDVSEFGTYRQNMQPMVGFNFAGNAVASARSRKVAKALAGYEGALPNTYGMKADELASLLTSYMLAANSQ